MSLELIKRGAGGRRVGARGNCAAGSCGPMERTGPLALREGTEWLDPLHDAGRAEETRGAGGDSR
jgi:hypothetical protein